MTSVYLSEDLASAAIRHFVAYISGYAYRQPTVVHEVSDIYGPYTHGNTYLLCAMRRLCLLAVVAAVVALCTGQKCPDNLGPNEVTFIPHPSNCSAYYRCTKSGPKLELCPSYHDMGQLCYNDKLQICDWSVNVSCCNPFIPGPSGQCLNSRKKPHSNCLQYIEDGRTVCCGENLAFNPKICVCDRILNVKSCHPSPAEIRECNWYTADRVSSLTRLADLVYGDNQPVAPNDDSFGAPSPK